MSDRWDKGSRSRVIRKALRGQSGHGVPHKPQKARHLVGDGWNRDRLPVLAKSDVVNTSVMTRLNYASLNEKRAGGGASRRPRQPHGNHQGMPSQLASPRPFWPLRQGHIQSWYVPRGVGIGIVRHLRKTTASAGALYSPGPAGLRQPCSPRRLVAQDPFTGETWALPGKCGSQSHGKGGTAAGKVRERAKGENN